MMAVLDGYTKKLDRLLMPRHSSLYLATFQASRLSEKTLAELSLPLRQNLPPDGNLN